jgi:hypothetical protein
MSRYGRPEIFNTDQGSQFSSPRFTDVLTAAGVKVSMDGKGRWMDNIFIAPVAVAEVRVRLPPCVRHRVRGTGRHRQVDDLLQCREAALGPRRTDTP